MKKSDLIAELERLEGDPEINVKFILRTTREIKTAEIDRINEFPSPEIIIVEK